MMRYETIVAASAAVLGFFGAARGGAANTAAAAQPVVAQAQQEDFRWSGRLARGQEIQINGIAGNVRAEPASGDQVEVIGRRRGEGARNVRIEAVQTEDGITICTIYPRRSGRDNDGRNHRGHGDGVCRGNNGNIDADDARIDFVVRVPAGVRLAAHTVEGDIVAEGLRGPVDAASVSGDVRVSTTGSARAATVSGDVTAQFGETDGEEMEFASVSGDVTLRLAGNVGAQVEAQTLSGEIHSDFPLRMGHMAGHEDDDDDGVRVDVRIGRSAKGTIGRGGPELSVNTVSGDIRLERGR